DDIVVWTPTDTTRQTNFSIACRFAKSNHEIASVHFTVTTMSVEVGVTMNS
ncbi:MAG: hypothetical protein RL753_72, partial [Bacteroidota bacterium]